MRLSHISVESNALQNVSYHPGVAPEAKVSGSGYPTSIAKVPSFLQRVFSFPAMLASLLVGAVCLTTRGFHVDPDLWWHIKVGDTILKTHTWPTTDTYSFTVSGQPWLAYEWLGEIVLALANRAGGFLGLEILLMALGGSILLALYGLASLHSGNSKAGFVASTILLALATVSFSLRPQMLGYLFLILTLLALERFRQGKYTALWFVPLVMLLWVNTHGSWIVGLGAILVYWLSGLVGFRAGSLQAKRWTQGERIRISGAFLLSLATVLITPYGPRIAASPFEFAFSLPLNATSIIEWQSMPFQMAGGEIFLALLLGTILMQVAGNYPWRLEELILFLFGLMMACLHVRFLLVFVPFFAPLLASIIAHWIPRYDSRKDKPALNAALMITVLAAILHFFPSRTDLGKSVAKDFPVGAVEYLRQHPVAEPMYDTYGFGGYLIWSRGPAHKVFIDGRGDVYERGGVLGDYLHIAHIKPGTLAVLDGYGVQSCLINRDEALATLLSASPHWHRAYSDSLSAIFVRDRKIQNALANGSN